MWLTCDLGVLNQVVQDRLFAVNHQVTNPPLNTAPPFNAKPKILTDFVNTYNTLRRAHVGINACEPIIAALADANAAVAAPAASAAVSIEAFSCFTVDASLVSDASGFQI